MRGVRRKSDENKRGCVDLLMFFFLLLFTQGMQSKEISQDKVWYYNVYSTQIQHTNARVAKPLRLGLLWWVVTKKEHEYTQNTHQQRGERGCHSLVNT